MCAIAWRFWWECAAVWDPMVFARQVVSEAKPADNQIVSANVCDQRWPPQRTHIAGIDSDSIQDQDLPQTRVPHPSSGRVS